VICKKCKNEYPDKQRVCDGCGAPNPSAAAEGNQPLPNNTSALGWLTSCSGCFIFPIGLMIGLGSLKSFSDVSSFNGIILTAAIISLVVVTAGIALIFRGKK